MAFFVYVLTRQVSFWPQEDGALQAQGLRHALIPTQNPNRQRSAQNPRR